MLALALIANNSRSDALRRRATAMGRERARHWMRRWPVIRARRTPIPLQHVIASDAAGRLGLATGRIQRNIRPMSVGMASRNGSK